MCNECFGNGFVSRHIAKATPDMTVSVSVSAPCPNCKPEEYIAWIDKRTQRKKKP